MKKKSLLLDGISNYIFFVPLVCIVTGIPSHWNTQQHLTYLATAVPIGILGGIVYGRFINKWRKWWKYD